MQVTSIRKKMKKEGFEMILKRMFNFPNYGGTSAFEDLERMRRDMDRLFGQVARQAY
jgi:hypothetical protein